MIRRMCLAAGIALLALVSVSAGVAAASAAPTVTVTPATDLADGDTITIAATGFTANQKLLVGQCADVNEVMLCDNDHGLSVTTDGTGSASTPSVARLKFKGYAGQEPAGEVDCGTVVCFIGVANEAFTELAGADISFRKP